MIILIIIFVLFVIWFVSLFRVPKRLSTLPKINIWTFMKTLGRKNSLNELFEKEIQPKLNEKGYAAMYLTGKWIVLTSHSEIAKQLFRNTSQFSKHIPFTRGLFAKFFGTKNVLNSNGEEWKRFRKPTNPIFHQTFQPDLFVLGIEHTFDVFSEKINQTPNEPIPVSDLMHYMALDQLGRGMFSIDFEAVKSLGKSKIYSLYESFTKQFFNPIYFLLPILHHYPMGKMAKAHADVAEFNKIIQDLIDERREKIRNNQNEESKDLLSTLLKHDSDNNYEPLTDEEIIHNLNIFFVAGHDTTANALACAMYYLARHPEIQDRMRKEVYDSLDVGSDNNHIVIPTIEQIKNMEYMGLFIKEVLRINPSITHISRTLSEDYIPPGDTSAIPKGTNVTLSIWGIHHDPKNFPNPDKFDPERFLNTKYDTDVYMPFGGGTRICVGVNFSLMEQKTYLTMLLQKFTLSIEQTNPNYEKLRVSGFRLPKPIDLRLNLTQRF